jgi:hypothetical protein
LLNAGFLLTFNGLHGVISQKKQLFTTTAVRTSNPTFPSKVVRLVSIAPRGKSNCRPLLQRTSRQVRYCKVKLLLCLINYTPPHEDVRRSGGLAPLFVTSALDGGEWSTLRLGRFTPGGQSPRYPFVRRLDGPQSQSGCCGVEKDPLLLSEIELWPFQPVAIPTELSRLPSRQVRK